MSKGRIVSPTPSTYDDTLTPQMRPISHIQVDVFSSYVSDLWTPASVSLDLTDRKEKRQIKRDSGLAAVCLFQRKPWYVIAGRA